MENLKSPDVGVSSAMEETPTSPHSEDKNLAMNCKTISSHQKGGGDLGNPTSGFITRNVRRSKRLNARVNHVLFIPSSNLV